jgi:hypothetical protein
MALPAIAAVAIGGLITTAIGGITNYLQQKEISRQKKAEAQQLRNNMKRLEEEIKRGEVEMGDALQRIDTLISTTKGELKNVMETQVNLAVDDIKKQYSGALREAMQNIRSGLATRRLLGSEAGTAATRRTTKEVEAQAERNIATLRERAAAEIAGQMSKLSLEGGLLKEAERKGQRRFRLDTLSEIMQIENLAGTLEAQAKTNPLLSVIAGAAPGIGQLTTLALTPGIEETEQIKPVLTAEELAKGITTQEDINV